MALVVSNAPSNTLQGSSYNPQGSSPYLQGSSPRLQGSSPRLQVTANPQTQALSLYNPAGPAAKTNPAADPYAAIAAAIKAASAAQQEVLAPTPDFHAINANATARANADVNPIYTKYLNNFLADQATAQATQKAITDQNIQNAQDTLKNTQKANEITGKRTTQDTATKEAQNAQTIDWRQTDQGGEYDMDRVAQAVQQSKAGTLGSGVGAGQQAKSQAKFNTTESRQKTQDIQEKVQLEQGKARTFEDLARSNELATQTEGKAIKAANFDLTTFMQNQTQNLRQEQIQLEDQRQAQLARAQAKFVQAGYQSFRDTITNPAQKAAFDKAYGNRL